MYVTCDIDDLMQMVYPTCDTNELMEMVDKNATKEMVDNSLLGYEMELFISNKLMKQFLVEDES
jgi:hypothetical protein